MAGKVLQNCRSFPVSAGHDAVVLILGSMPGVESLRRQEYYAHPRNSFWKLMGELLGFDPALPYEARLQKLLDHKIALWDTVHACARYGSLDADIKHVEPNNFELFFKRHKAVKAIFFNGRTAYSLFRRHTGNMQLPELDCRVMPSTSPAHAAKNYAQKLLEWNTINEYLHPPREPREMGTRE